MYRTDGNRTPLGITETPHPLDTHPPPPPPPYPWRKRRLCSSRKTSWDWLGKQWNKKVSNGAVSLKTRGTATLRCRQNRIFNHRNKIQKITSIFWLIIIPSVALIKSRIKRLELGSITEKKCAQLLTIALVTSCKLEGKKVKQENILNIRHLRNERETGSSLHYITQRLLGMLLGSLRNDVFERRTSTGSRLFALFSRGFEEILGQNVSLRV